MFDSWILDKCIAKWPTFVNCLESTEFKLNSFISEGKWNNDHLQLFFGEQLIDHITQIPIDAGRRYDLMELKTKFSGKSIAALDFQALTDNNGRTAIWNWMKKLKLRPNVELFWWRLCNVAIPSNDFLFRRRLSIFSGCPRGCEEDENGCHIAGKCGKLRDVISILNSWGFKLPFFANLHECLEGLKKLVGKDSFIANMYCTTTWLVWKSICKLIHDGIEDSLNSLAARAVSTATVSNFINSTPDNWDTNQ
ncbi:hypothetical protein KFK09_004734 [Dendrobium nobile]|uniref:Reverse transcriptase zinc-binding domain-containing protein n=1 Tax=Dendrobium nobile TaxID=94219 RepID=A0A8T3BZ18_DENNO|nr:hypothetical protein KFK09_004734 [Dendrobium nobile]